MFNLVFANTKNLVNFDLSEIFECKHNAGQNFQAENPPSKLQLPFLSLIRTWIFTYLPLESTLVVNCAEGIKVRKITYDELTFHNKLMHCGTQLTKNP